MKPFEERYSEWVDGRLSGPELDAFLRELPDRSAAEVDLAEAHRLGDLLRQHSETPKLSNPDFFMHQLEARIQAESAPAKRPAAAKPDWSFFSLPNLLWATACCVLLGSSIYFARLGPAGLAVNKNAPILPIAAINVAPTPANSRYSASILETKAMEPGVSASVYAEDENVTVLWLDGLDYLPASYALQ